MAKRKKRQQNPGSTFIPYRENDDNVKRMDDHLQAEKARRTKKRQQKPQVRIPDGTIVRDRSNNISGIVVGTTEIPEKMRYKNDTFAYRLRVGDEIKMASPFDVVKEAEGDKRLILHREYLSSLGINEQQYVPRRKRSKYRDTHCWRCETQLDSASDVECVRCGWLICNYFWSPRPEFAAQFFTEEQMLETRCAFSGEIISECPLSEGV